MKVISFVIVALGTVTKGFVKELADLEIGWRVEIIQTIALWRFGQNTEKIPGDLRFAVTQKAHENYLQTLMWKNLKGVQIRIIIIIPDLLLIIKKEKVYSSGLCRSSKDISKSKGRRKN